LPFIEQGNLITGYTSPGLATLVSNAYATPIKTYIAPADPFNPGTDSRISYACNSALLNPLPRPTKTNAAPRFPASFNGRTSQVILVFEHSPVTFTAGMADPGPTDNTSVGPYWCSTGTISTGTGFAGISGAFSTTSGPFLGNKLTAACVAPNFGSPATWENAQPHALTSAGIVVGMGDGSSRIVTSGAAASVTPLYKVGVPLTNTLTLEYMETTAWQWAIDPNNPNPEPSGW
jgi:hypothetical protein